MAREIILGLLNDYIFKNVFGVDGHENLLQFLVNTVLLDKGFNPVRKVTLKNTELIKESYWQKTSILDIRAEDEFGRSVNIEVQVRDVDNFRGRSLKYWARLHCLQEQEGDLNEDLQPTICINILNFNMFEDDKFHHCIMTKDIDENGEIFSPDLQIHYIELKKVKEITTKLEELAYILKNLTEDTGDDMKNLLYNDPYYKEIQNYFETCVQDESARYEAIVREKNMLDYASGMYAAEKKGIQLGLEQGAHEKTISTVKKALAMGISVSDISELTGLSSDEIESIGKEK